MFIFEIHSVGIILNYVLITTCVGSDLEGSVCHRAERLIFEDFSPQGVPIISLNFILVNHQDDSWLWLEFMEIALSLSRVEFGGQALIIPGLTALACLLVPSLPPALMLHPWIVLEY